MVGINLVDIAVLQQLCKNRKVIIFGTGHLAADYGRVLSTIGLCPIFYLDIIGNGEPDKRIRPGEIIPVEKALEVKEEAYILLTEERGQVEQAGYLIDKGFRYVDNFNFISGAHFQTRLSRDTSLDPTMGYSTKSDNVYGCRFLGKNHKSDYRIAVNGASLVDETSFEWKLWPQLLYESLMEKEKQVSFLLCATYGHTTSQCLLKLLRDILPLKPDMVIDYLSFENDCCYGERIKTPFVTGYQKKILSLVKNQVKDKWEAKKANTICWGNTAGKRTSDVILDNIFMSRLLCESYGIRYICVFPPSITTQRVRALPDIELQWAYDRYGRISRKVYAEIEEKMSDEIKECIVDARSWMDEYEGMFYDQFHMKETGNRIIADKMLEILGI